MRNYKEIRKWMIDKGITGAAIARELKISRTLVCMTLTSQHHRRDSRLVLQYVLDKGCPAKYLHLPEDMRRAV